MLVGASATVRWFECDAQLLERRLGAALALAATLRPRFLQEEAWWSNGPLFWQNESWTRSFSLRYVNSRGEYTPTEFQHLARRAQAAEDALAHPRRLDGFFPKVSTGGFQHPIWTSLATHLEGRDACELLQKTRDSREFRLGGNFRNESKFNGSIQRTG